MSAFARFRGAFALFGALLGGVVVPVQSWASEAVCYRYKFNDALPWENSVKAAASDWVAWAVGAAHSSYCYSGAPYSCTYTVSAITGTAPNYHLTVHHTECNEGYCPYDNDSSAGSVIWRVNPDGCPADPCEHLEGLPTAQGGAGARPESGYACAADDGEGGSGNICQVQLQGAGISTGTGWFGQGKFTGITGACGEDEPASTNAPNCVSGPGGQVCVSKQKQDCGVVNGEAVCLDKVPAGNCLLLSGGGAMCDSSAGSPPAPTNSMGEPVTPTSEVTRTDSMGATTTYNYYSSSVVNNSSTPVEGSDNGLANDGGGDGDGDGVEECESDADCFGAPPADECGDSLVSCIGEAAAGVYDNFGSTPLFAAVTGLYAAIPNSGTCPSATVEVFDESVDAMASFCSVMADSGGDDLLGLFFAICWSLGGLRILLGGGE